MEPLSLMVGTRASQLQTIGDDGNARTMDVAERLDAAGIEQPLQRAQTQPAGHRRDVVIGDLRGLVDEPGIVEGHVERSSRADRKIAQHVGEHARSRDRAVESRVNRDRRGELRDAARQCRNSAGGELFFMANSCGLRMDRLNARPGCPLPAIVGIRKWNGFSTLHQPPAVSELCNNLDALPDQSPGSDSLGSRHRQRLRAAQIAEARARRPALRAAADCADEHDVVLDCAARDRRSRRPAS